MTLAHIFFTLTTWVLYGDFHMVEKYSKKVSKVAMRWNLEKQEAWFFMKNKLGLFDPNYIFSPIEFLEAQWFTWSNFQVDKICILKCIDRSMISKCDFFHFHILSSTFPFISIVPHTTLLDHSFILFVIYFSQAPTHNFPLPFYLNTSFL